LHEIKHDRFRIIARKNGSRVRLYNRPGNDLTHRFPLIVETLSRLRSRILRAQAPGRAGDVGRLAGARATGPNGPAAAVCKVMMLRIVTTGAL
jgi:hypothetical protein